MNLIFKLYIYIFWVSNYTCNSNNYIIFLLFLLILYIFYIIYLYFIYFIYFINILYIIYLNLNFPFQKIKFK